MHSIFFIVVFLIVAFLVHRYYKTSKARALIGRLSGIDSAWEPEKLTRRVENIYNRVRKALENRDAESVRELVTERLFELIKGKNLGELGFRKPGTLTTVFSTRLRFIEVLDYKDNSRDRAGVLVTHTTVTLGRKESGPPAELWTFARGGAGWLLDDIDPKFTILEEIGAKIYSEELSGSREKLVIVAEPADYAAENSSGKTSGPARGQGGPAKLRYGVGYKKDYIRKYRK